MANKVTCYDDEELCQDLARADDSIKDIAAKHKVSASLLYRVARGESRPELKPRIDELIAAEKAAGARLAKSRARWFMGRLIQLAALDSDIGLKAVIKGLELAGLGEGMSTGDKQTIEIILSAGKGDGKDNPIAKRLTGVYNGNGNN